MPATRDGRAVIATRNGRRIAASRNGQPVIIGSDKPHPTIAVSPEYAANQLDLSQDGVLWTWDWDTAVADPRTKVTLPDGTVITDLAVTSHRQHAFARTAGQPYPDITGRIVGKNAAGEGDPAEATLTRWWAPVITVVTSQAPGFVAEGVAESRFWVDVTVQGHPFPTDLAIDVVRTGVPSSHQINRSFASEASDSQFRRTHRFQFSRAATRRGNERFVLTGSVRRRDGRELSNTSHAFTLGW